MSTIINPTARANSAGGEGLLDGRVDSALVALDPEALRAAALGVPTTRIAVFSTSEVLAHGVIGLLPEQWRQSTAIVSDVDELEQVIGGSRAATVIDADAARGADAVRATRAQGGSVVVLLGRAGPSLDPGILEDADAILFRDEVGSLALLVALVAGRLDMRLMPRALSPTARAAPQDCGLSLLSEPARRVVMLLAEGMRDAEMAQDLNLSKSAVRKLVQRTVHCMGARTRCEAVAIAARSGELRRSG
jgi:DNA-binding NarL/FixJ family response regulator